MSVSTGKTTKVLTVLVAALVAVAAFQMLFLYRMYSSTASANTWTTAENEKNDGSDSVVKLWHLNPGQKSPNQNVPLNNPAPVPFDPNSWDPFKEMDEMHQRMDRLFDEAFGKFNSSPRFGNLAQGLSFNPKTDMSEDDRQYVIRMDIPGTDQSKVKATLEDRTLTISGIRDEEVEHKLPGKAISKERRLGEFERSITLPGPVKQDGMQVSYDKGVLTVTVPKDTTQPKSGGNLLPMQ